MKHHPSALVGELSAARNQRGRGAGGRGPVVILAAALLFAGLAPAPARAQDSEPTGRIDYPLQVLNVASVERLLQKAEVMFTAADRLEGLDLTTAFLAGTLKDLPGFDKTKPFGLMFFLKPGLTPGIGTVAYFPVAELDPLLAYFAGTEGSVRAVSGKSRSYELQGGIWGQDLYVKHVGNYIFLVDSDEQAELDRNFPDPQRVVGRLSNRYDIAYSLMLRNIPPAIKTIFMEFFKNSSLASLQQRDDEPDAAYRIRRSQGESLVDWLDKIVNQGEDLTVGGFIHPETKAGLIEFELNGTKESKLAKFFQDMSGRRSLFAPIVDEDATFSMSSSVQMDPKQRKAFTDLFQLGPGLLADEVKGRAAEAAAVEALKPITKALETTFDQGHLDYFVQLSGTELQDYRVLAGLRISGQQDFPAQMTALLDRLKEIKTPDDENANKILAAIKTNDKTLGEFAVHTVPLPTPPDRFGQVLFGDKPNLYIYPTPNALWLAFGGETALDRLEHAVKLSVDPDAIRKASPITTGLFTLVTNSQQWVNAALATGETEDDKEMDMLKDSFAADNDALRVVARPTESGLRVRADFEGGFVAWMGDRIYQQMTEQPRRPRTRPPRPQRAIPAPAP